MPSSSLVEVEVEAEVGVEVGVGGSRMVGLTFSVRWVEWVGGWVEIWRVKLISTQVLVEVEVGVELGNNYPKKGRDKKGKNEIFIEGVDQG